MNVGVLYSRIRRDEKLLLRELRDRGHEVTKIDVRKERFGLHEAPDSFVNATVVRGVGTPASARTRLLRALSAQMAAVRGSLTPGTS